MINITSGHFFSSASKAKQLRQMKKKKKTQLRDGVSLTHGMYGRTCLVALTDASVLFVSTV